METSLIAELDELYRRLIADEPSDHWKDDWHRYVQLFRQYRVLNELETELEEQKNQDLARLREYCAVVGRAEQAYKKALVHQLGQLGAEGASIATELASSDLLTLHNRKRFNEKHHGFLDRNGLYQSGTELHKLQLAMRDGIGARDTERDLQKFWLPTRPWAGFALIRPFLAPGFDDHQRFNAWRTAESVLSQRGSTRPSARSKEPDFGWDHVLESVLDGNEHWTNVKNTRTFLPPLHSWVKSRIQLGAVRDTALRRYAERATRFRARTLREQAEQHGAVSAKDEHFLRDDLAIELHRDGFEIHTEDHLGPGRADLVSGRDICLEAKFVRTKDGKTAESLREVRQRLRDGLSQAASYAATLGLRRGHLAVFWASKCLKPDLPREVDAGGCTVDLLVIDISGISPSTDKRKALTMRAADLWPKQEHGA